MITSQFWTITRASSTLLSNRHYGLAGMHERANLIGADMLIEAQPGKGTRIQQKWASKNGFESGTISS
jgi:signal transduction histidine kinase